MRVVLPNHEDRISPVLDVARQIVFVEVVEGRALGRRVVRIEDGGLLAKAKRILELRPDVVICGAVSRPLEAMLDSFGVRVMANSCGAIDEIIAAFAAGEMTEDAFLMPGCTGRRRRCRQRRRCARDTHIRR